MAAYGRDKLRGLVRRPRKDRGAARAISAAALMRAIALRQEGTHRSTPTLIDIVVRSDEVATSALRGLLVETHRGLLQTDPPIVTKGANGAIGARSTKTAVGLRA